jgi:hypothetical protein
MRLSSIDLKFLKNKKILDSNLQIELLKKKHTHDKIKKP